MYALPSDHTKALLLLCGYLGSAAAKPLNLTEYNRLAKWLHTSGLRPADLLTPEAEDQLKAFQDKTITAARLHALLERGLALGLALDEWGQQGLWVLGRGEEPYPQMFKKRLGNTAPPLLYGSGDPGLLSGAALGIVGSRDADPAALAFTQAIARTCAKRGVAVVSGGAKGVDQEAMFAALEAGGQVIAVLPEGISRVATSKKYRTPIMQGQLVLVSPFHPHARWSAGNAMGRNKHIYAFSQATLVARSSTKGGTWSGATENTKKRWVPLLVRAGEDMPDGNKQLLKQGGLPCALEDLDNDTPWDALVAEWNQRFMSCSLRPSPSYSMST